MTRCDEHGFLLFRGHCACLEAHDMTMAQQSDKGCTQVVHMHARYAIKGAQGRASSTMHARH